VRAQWRRDLDRLPVALDITRGIAADVYPKGAALSCFCGHTQHATMEEIGEYLHSGWPVHCGFAMGPTAL
jgi:hypothetical protein